MELCIKNPKARADWRPGETAYYYDNGTRKIVPVTVTRPLVANAEVKLSAFFKKAVPMASLFETRAEAVTGYEKYCEEQAKTYMNEIKGINDLVEFPLKHCITRTPNDTNWIARQVYLTKAKELLDLDIGDETRNDNNVDTDTN